MNHWEKHFKYYDFFQNRFSPYCSTLDWHVKQMNGFDKILDSGSGTGNLSLELLKNNHFVYAIDSEASISNILKTKTKEYPQIEFRINSAEKTNFPDNYFDGITSMFVLPFVENINNYLHESYRVLKKDCKISITSWAPEKDIFPEIKKLMEEEFETEGILPKYQKEWNYFLESSKTNANQVIQQESIENIKSIMKEIGFKEINTFQENPYGRFAYFLTAKK